MALSKRRDSSDDHISLARTLRKYAGSADSYAMFNLLTGPHLLDRVEALVPEHRERLFPLTETLSMFLAQKLAADPEV
jgi:hypothetical protein